MPAQPREEMISVGGIKVHTLIGGRGDPLLALHGAGGSSGWRRWHAALAERYTIYAPSHPGFDLSDSADWMADVRDLACFYLWFLDEVGIQRTHLVGHSMGGWTAAEMATMCPRAIDRLVLVSAVGLKPDQGEIFDVFYSPLEQVRELAFRDPAGTPEYAELYGQPPTPEQRDIALRNREMAARLAWKPYMFNPRLPHFLPRASMPTLIIWGRQDQIVPAICGEQYQRALPNAELRVLEACGHFPPLERPGEFVDLVAGFLGG